jgi:FtsZ-interacting cell division protein YlmF
METLETAGIETLRQWVRDWFEWAEKVEVTPSGEERWHGMCERLEEVFRTCESESRLANERRERYEAAQREQESARTNYLNRQSEFARTSERQLATARTTMKKIALSADASFRYLAFEAGKA